MNRRFLSVTTFTLLFFTPQLARAEEMQPGEYASTGVFESANGQKRTLQDRDCVTAKDIADGMTKLGIERDDVCKVQNLVKGNGKISYRLVCEEDGQKWSAEVVGTYTANSYEFAMKATSPGPGAKSINVTGKRLGPCK